MDSISEEITGVRDQKYQTTLEFRKPPNIGVLQRERRAYTHDDSNHKTSHEDHQENTDSLKQAENSKVASSSSSFVPLCGFKQHDSNGIVQDGLPKDDSV